MAEKIDKEILEILNSENIWERIVFDELDKKIVGERKSREIIFLCALGRLVINSSFSSFNLLMHSESSAGKDYTTKAVLSLFPEPYVFSRTRISPTVLNYWKPYQKLGQDHWNGCILYLPDVNENILNSDALKLMCSDGSHITVTEKGEAKDIEIKGKPIIFSTTANSTPSEEILNRFSIVHLDESEEQTKQIFFMQSKRAEEGLSSKFDEKIKKAMMHLKRYEVKIPFATKIANVFPHKKISQRRNFERFLDYIKSVTIFYQFQREIEGNTIIAEARDYDKARDVFMNIQCGVSSIPINRRQKEIVEVLSNQEGEPIGLSDLHKQLKNYIALNNLKPHIDSLVNLRIVDKQFGSDKFGRELVMYTLGEEYKDFKPIKLPTSHNLLFKKE